MCMALIMYSLVDPWKGKRGFGGDVFWAYLLPSGDSSKWDPCHFFDMTKLTIMVKRLMLMIMLILVN